MRRRRKDIIMFIFLSFSFLLFLLCLTALRYSNISVMTSPIGNTVITILSNLNLLSYRSYIGGHQVHFSDFAFIVFAIIFPLAYAGVTGFLINREVNVLKKIGIHPFIRALIILYVVLISFIVFLWVISLLLFEIERFAYAFFVPQV